MERINLLTIAKINATALERGFGCNKRKTHYIWYVGTDDLIYTNDKNYKPENGVIIETVIIE